MVGDHQRRAGGESSPELLEGAQPLLRGQEMQRQQAGGAVEMPLAKRVDIALVEVHASLQRTQRLPGQGEHLRRGIDPREAPAGLCLGERLQLQTAAAAFAGQTAGQAGFGAALDHLYARQQGAQPLGGLARALALLADQVELVAGAQAFAAQAGGQAAGVEAVERFVACSGDVPGAVFRRAAHVDQEAGAPLAVQLGEARGVDQADVFVHVRYSPGVCIRCTW